MAALQLLAGDVAFSQRSDDAASRISAQQSKCHQAQGGQDVKADQVAVKAQCLEGPYYPCC